MEYKTTAKTDRPCILCPKTIKRGNTCYVSSGRGSVCEKCHDRAERWAEQLVKNITLKDLQRMGRY